MKKIKFAKKITVLILSVAMLLTCSINGGSYSVKITNNDRLEEDYHYLVGSGKVESL